MKKIAFLSLFVLSFNTYADTLCIAHRGYHSEAPDNSLSAFIAAQAVGADGIELDIVHTKEGIPIVNHDHTFKKTGIDLAGKVCPKSTPINELSLSEIKDKCTLSNGEPVATLEEALDVITSQDQLLFLELKDKPSEKTAQLVYNYYKEKINSLRVIAFNKGDYKTLRSADKSLKSFWKQVKFLKLSVKPWALTKIYGVNVSMPGYKTRRKFFKRFRRELSVWTVNKVKNLEMLFKDKVDYITTDNLETCLSLK
jgi:glycerophosphoryl diester phosphodiesterase